MIYITGIGRSGTSLLARLFLRNGYKIIDNWVDSHRMGHEDREVYLLNDRLLKLRRQGCKKLSASFRTQIERLGSAWEVIKDPRFLETLRFWQEVYPVEKVFVCLRDPQKVRSSLPDLPPHLYAFDAMTKRLSSFLLDCSIFGWSWSALEYPDDFLDFKKFKAITGLEIEPFRQELKFRDEEAVSRFYYRQSLS